MFITRTSFLLPLLFINTDPKIPCPWVLFHKPNVKPGNSGCGSCVTWQLLRWDSFALQRSCDQSPHREFWKIDLEHKNCNQGISASMFLLSGQNCFLVKILKQKHHGSCVPWVGPDVFPDWFSPLLWFADMSECVGSALLHKGFKAAPRQGFHQHLRSNWIQRCD